MALTCPNRGPRRHPQLARWPQFHIARAELLRRDGREAEAAEALRAARRLNLPPAERTLIEARIGQPGPPGAAWPLAAPGPPGVPSPPGASPA